MSKHKGRLVPKVSSGPTEPDGLDDGTQNPEGGVAPESAEPITEPTPETGKVSDRLGLGLVDGITRMRRMDFQDALFEANREMRLTDHQLALVMDCEHPWGVHIPDHYIVGMRRLYNEGKHTKHQVKPATPVPAFDEAGNVVSGRRRRAVLAKAVGETEPADAADLNDDQA
jgi:hypothetical protein